MAVQLGDIASWRFDAVMIVRGALILTVPGTRADWWHALSGDTGLTIAALYALAYSAMRRQPLRTNISQTAAS